MKQSSRVRVAAVVGAAASGKRVSSVYDYSIGTHRSISADVSGGRVTGYDYSTSSHFSGSGSDLGFYDYEFSAHVQLRVDENQFSGYDYNTSSHFSGTVNGGSIALYDYETSRYYNYSV